MIQKLRPRTLKMPKSGEEQKKELFYAEEVSLED